MFSDLSILFKNNSVKDHISSFKSHQNISGVKLVAIAPVECHRLDFDVVRVARLYLSQQLWFSISYVKVVVITSITNDKDVPAFRVNINI
ncbi:MAG: hypothetical protein KDD45_10130, partial [Bdellovibrionales bacterium]|nr:hypothetical protein [Bdellovibrionales bacterium]